MSADAKVLSDIGSDFVLKAGARVVPGAIMYGIYLILTFRLLQIFYQHGKKTRGIYYLIFATVLMFLGGTLFLCLDTADLIRRMAIILVDNPEQTFQEKLNRADATLKKTVWTGQMLFIFMIVLGDSIVIWRTWTLYLGARKWVGIPIATWAGSTIAAVFELGCHLKTHWEIKSLEPSASSVGAKTCASADFASFTLSYITNILCTILIAFKAWQHRKEMTKYLGRARRDTQVEKVFTLLIESGSIYVLIYTLQAVPINGAKLNAAGLAAFNVVNAIYQQALGMYPTVIMILVQQHKSLWDTPEVSDIMFATAPGTASKAETSQFVAEPGSSAEISNATTSTIISNGSHSCSIHTAMV